MLREWSRAELHLELFLLSKVKAQATSIMGSTNTARAKLKTIVAAVIIPKCWVRGMGDSKSTAKPQIVVSAEMNIAEPVRSIVICMDFCGLSFLRSSLNLSMMCIE